MIEKILAALAGIATLFALFWRRQAKRASQYKRATEILKEDARIDAQTEERKDEVESLNTADDFKREFDRLRSHGE